MQALVESNAAKSAHNKGKSGCDEGGGGSGKCGDEIFGSGGEGDGASGEEGGDGGEGDEGEGGSGSAGGETGGAERTTNSSIPIRPWVKPRVAIIVGERRGRNGE